MRSVSDGLSPAITLVEQQEAGAGGERPGDFQALAVRQGQVGGVLAGPGVELEQFEEAARRGLRLRHVPDAVQRRYGDVLEHGHLGEGLDELERAADAGMADPIRPLPR